MFKDYHNLMINKNELPCRRLARKVIILLVLWVLIYVKSFKQKDLAMRECRNLLYFHQDQVVLQEFEP